jgi:hypothetical protein
LVDKEKIEEFGGEHRLARENKVEELQKLFIFCWKFNSNL